MRTSAKSSTTFLLMLLAASAATGCTSLRIIRYREPMPGDVPHIFAQRAVRHADAPFVFARAAALRNDLDTLSIRDVDGAVKSFARYASERKIHGFLVIRNDTILYERYTPPLSDTGVWNAYSATKSVTSIVLGLALQSGAVRSLDDPVTDYVRESRDLPAFQGVTLRHLLGMKSGLAYTRTNGSLWHDFRSSDAHFFYTSNRLKSILSEKREDPPGTRWAYKDLDPDLLAVALSRATGKSLAQQLEDGVWRRIGTEHDASYSLDHANGLEDAASGLNAIARDYARIGRLMLHFGRWDGTQVVDSNWAALTTQLDTTRSEPEVVTWYRMQHQGYWWIPMHNWTNERDFFADGSRGQRIYVHRPTNTIIVQLADDSNQEFPFRKIVHFFDGSPYAYPTGIAGATLRAARISADSGARVLVSLLEQESRNPAAFTVNEAGVLSVVETLRAEGRPDAAAAVLKAGAARYSGSCRYATALKKAGLPYAGESRRSACATP